MKRKSVKKIIASLSAVMVLTAFCLQILPACGNGGQGQISDLIGKFTYSAETEVLLTNDSAKMLQGSAEDGKPYIYTSDVYPLNTIVEETVVYSVSQTLRLKRDYTYEYVYDILLKKVTQSGNTELARIDVSAKGTFEYEQNFDVDYTVNLSNPDDGEELRYGASIADEGNIYSWRLSSAANYRLDIGRLSKGAEPRYDRYVTGRSVNVERGEDKVLYDDIFYKDLLEDIAPFCSFASSSSPVEKPEEPDNPEEPLQTVSFVDLPETSVEDVGVKMRVGATPALVFETDEIVSVLNINGAEISASDNQDGKNTFEYPLEYSALGVEIYVETGRSSFEFSPISYLTDLTVSAGGQTLSQKALTSFSVSVLNAARAFGANVELTRELSALVYESIGNNLYHSDWGKRDNISEEDAADKAKGFVWEGLPAIETENGTLLKYFFSVNAGEYLNPRAKITVGNGEPYEVVAEKTEDKDGRIFYSVETDVVSPIDFDKPVSFEIFDGNNKISSKAVYSVNRAVAKADLSDSETARDTAKALYSLAKSAMWYLNRETVTYSYLPPVNGAGRYELVIGEYSYNDGRMSVAQQVFVSSGSSLYMAGTVTSDGVKENLGSGFTVTKVGEKFTVTLGGASVDGIRATDKALKSVNILLKGTSNVNNILLSAFGDDTPAASIKTLSDLTISGNKGAVLNVYGNIYVKGTLTVENVTVNVYGCSNVSAVACGKLNVLHGGALNTESTFAESTAAGIYADGDINIDGSLSSKGYNDGVFLGGNSSQRLTVTNGNLYIAAKAYGITGNSTAAAKTNRKLTFNGGESYVRAGSGVRYGDISVGDALLTVIADVGYTVEAENPVTIRTTSGDFRRGSLTLVNNAYNAWWDVNYTVKVSNLLLDGGNVYIFGMCKDGVVHAETGAVISVNNCDLTVENGQNIKEVHGRGLNLNSGDEKVEIANSAKVIFRNCDAAVNCYGKSDGAENYAKFVNYGLVILDSYKCHLLPWNGENNVASWEMKIDVENNGEIRTANYIS